jgi:hypothetical protein
MRHHLVAAALLAAGLLPAGGAQAKLTQHPRECILDVGPARMMFGAFQEGKTDETFCRHVPELGRTMLIIDAEQPELRDMRVELFVLRDVGQKAWNDDLDRTMVARAEPKAYFARSGTMTFTHDFTKDGPYLAVVRATSADGGKEYVGSYAFTMGEGVWSPAAYLTVFLAFCFVASGVWLHHSAPRPKTPSRPAPQPTATPPRSERASGDPLHP